MYLVWFWRHQIISVKSYKPPMLYNTVCVQCEFLKLGLKHSFFPSTLSNWIITYFCFISVKHSWYSKSKTQWSLHMFSFIFMFRLCTKSYNLRPQYVLSVKVRRLFHALWYSIWKYQVISNKGNSDWVLLFLICGFEQRKK